MQTAEKRGEGKGGATHWTDDGTQGREERRGNPRRKFHADGAQGGITRCSIPLFLLRLPSRGEARRGEVRLTLRGPVRFGFQVIPEGLIVKLSR
jgi:hypothetical protein